jgi:hypothetical protein
MRGQGLGPVELEGWFALLTRSVMVMPEAGMRIHPLVLLAICRFLSRNRRRRVSSKGRCGGYFTGNGLRTLRRC